MAGQRLRYQILGPLRVEGADGQVGLPRSAVVRGLLGVLLLAEGEPLPLTRLGALVWSDRPEAVDRGAIYVGVSRLRDWLRGQAGDDAPAVEQSGGGYRLAVRPDDVDLGQFRLYLARAGETGDPQERHRLLLSATELLRGPVLADLTGLDTADPLLRSVEDAVRDAGLAFGAAAAAAGRPKDAVGTLEALARHRPLDEPVHARLIEVLAAAGQPAQALTWFEQLRTRLADELGVVPSELVQRAHLQVLAGDRELAVPGGAKPAQLPPDTSGFTGRTPHLGWLDALLSGKLDRPANAVVVTAVEGTAGVGKTALAVHWAHRVRNRFPDGQLYVDLRGYSVGIPVQPIEALAAFLHALGTPAEQIPVDVERAAGMYRSRLADRSMLVVLDNARTVEQVRPLLPGSPGCLALITSRDRLGGLIAREGAYRLVLDVLGADEADALLVRILGAVRVRAEPQAAAGLARACAYLPLALRIAAANLTDYPDRRIADYVAELTEDNLLAALEVEGDQESAVSAAFALSYAALPPVVQRLFRLLSLVPGPDFTVDAAAAPSGGTAEESGRLLDRLASAYLINSVWTGRYAFHDLLRLFSARQAEQHDSAAERAAATHRLYDHYLHAADAAARMLYPEKLRLPVPEPVALFDSEGPALAWLEAERADGDLRGAAAARLSLGDCHRCLALHEEAVEHFTSAVALNEQTGWLEGQAAALGNLGNLYGRMGRLAECAEHHLRALEIDRQTGRLVGQAATLCNLANVSLDLGRLDSAAEYLTDGIRIDQELGLRAGEGMDRCLLGEVLHALGRFDEAREHLDRALVLLRETGDRAMEAESLRALAEVNRDTGRAAEAYELATTALTLAHETGDRWFESQALITVAALDRDRGEPAKAVAGCQRALELAREGGLPFPEIIALIGLAAAYQAQGGLDGALEAAGSAVRLAAGGGYRHAEGLALTALAEVHLARDEVAEAGQRAEQAVAVHRETGHRLGEARALVLLGRCVDNDGAVAHWRQGYRLFTELGSPEADQVRALLP
jgi:DNA-binding SARP family transcriptional activator